MKNAERGARNAERETPLLMCGEMVRQTLAGVKTETRRVVKPQPGEGTLRMYAVETLDFERQTGEWVREFEKAGGANDGARWTDNVKFRSPYGVPGDRLWVRETWAPHDERTMEEQDELMVYYRADDETQYESDGPWRPSIFMPRWASRITLEIVEVRVERVQEITAAGCIAEGVTYPVVPVGRPGLCRPAMRITGKYPPSSYLVKGAPVTHEALLRAHYASLWDSLNADRESRTVKRGELAWARNPWVWVVKFKRSQATPEVTMGAGTPRREGR